MVEILWKTADTPGPLKERELFELHLVDLGVYEKPRFLVGEFHGRWTETHQRVMWDRCQEEKCSSPEEATRRYQDRRTAILGKGFIRSDVEIPRCHDIKSSLRTGRP